MANNVVPFQMAPAFAEALNPAEQFGEGINAAGFNRISIKGKRFTLFHEGAPYQFTTFDTDGNKIIKQHIDCVVLAENPKTARTYYADAYVEGSNASPTCASSDGIRPDSGTEIQAKSCHNCLQNQWPGGRRAKPCKENRRVALLLTDGMFKGKHGPNTQPPFTGVTVFPVFFRIAPDSLKAYKQYCDHLHSIGAHPSSVVTRISFEEKEQNRLKFEMIRPLTNADAPVVLPLRTSTETKALIGTGPALLESSGSPPPIQRPKPVVEEDNTGFGGQQETIGGGRPLNPYAQERGRLAAGDDAPVPQRQQRAPVIEDDDEATAAFGEQTVTADASEASEETVVAEPPKRRGRKPAAKAASDDDESGGAVVKNAGDDLGLDGLVGNLQNRMKNYQST